MIRLDLKGTVALNTHRQSKFSFLIHILNSKMDIAEKYTNKQVYLSEDCSQKEEVL